MNVDININSLKICRDRLNFNYNNMYNLKLIKGNDTNLKIIPNDKIDFIFAHPPYVDIIRYSENIIQDLARLKIKEFLG